MRMIDADSLESKLPAHSNDSNHVMTRNFAVESFRALIKAEPTVTPPPVYAKGILLDQAVRCALQYAFPKAIMNLRLELIVYPARNTTVPLYGADTLDELNARIIEWCSREACKSYSSASQKYHLNGINQFCGTIYTRTSMDYIYTYLGNGINPGCCRQGERQAPAQTQRRNSAAAVRLEYQRKDFPPLQARILLHTSP